GARAGPGDGRPGSGELSLEQVLKSYEQPINEEQAWAVCYQCSRGLADTQTTPSRIRDPSSLLLHRDGTVTVLPEHRPITLPVPLTASLDPEMVQCLGFAIYRALDWGLDDSEERELSPQLEQFIDLMANSDSEGALTDEGYEDPEDEDEDGGQTRVVRSFSSVLRICASRLPEPHEAQSHYQAVCRALFAETVELRAFLKKIREAKEVLMKLRVEESEPDGLVNLQNTDWACLWVQLMKDLRHGVQLKKVRENTFNSLPTEYQLTPFEMLMQDIRARNYKLRTVTVGGDIPTKVKKDAHEVILDFIRSRPPLKPVSQRNLPPLPFQQRSLHEKILEEIKQEPKLRPVETQKRGHKGFGSLPCIVDACSTDVKSTSCINLSVPDSGAPRLRPRVLLKAPTLAEMEEMNLSEVMGGSPLPLKRDRSFSEQDLAQLQCEMGHPPQHLLSQEQQAQLRAGGHGNRLCHGQQHRTPLAGECCGGTSLMRSLVDVITKAASVLYEYHLILMQEFSHPVDTLALTVEEVINVRRVLVKAEMEKFLPRKELYTNLKKGKICCCCKVKFPLLSWPSNCLFCKSYPSKIGGSHSKKDTFQSCGGLSLRNIEVQFPHIYAQGSTLKDVCSDCACFIRDVVCSSRKSVDILNRQSQSGTVPTQSRSGKRL
uniref:Spire type actin nucleation factor 2 n=1 Tax=Leptobrachium leishanense TaxID=445787 RepID=A0A8C5WKW3_9ANUR